MSGRISKSQIPFLAHASLPTYARIALIEAKNKLKHGTAEELAKGTLFRTFQNKQGATNLEGPPLPAPDLGCQLFEFDVGQAHEGDPKGRRGVKRLVLEINISSKQIMEVYLTEEHYAKTSFVRIT